MKPLVSIIVPVYNVLPYLREALDSVINQTYKNLEILIVDDGSTDGSGEICDEYLSDPRVIVIHQENKGLSGARNTALDRMTGEYVAFLDSDDAFMPDMIEKNLEAVTRNKAEMSVCGYFACETNSQMTEKNILKHRSLIFDKEQVISPAQALNLIVAGNRGWYAWNKLYSQAIWKQVRFPEGDNYEDLRIMCLLIEQCKQIVTIPDVPIFYRLRAGSITNRQTEKNLQDYLLAIHAVEDFIRKHKLIGFSQESIHSFQEFHARILSNKYAQLIRRPYSTEAKAKFRKEIMLRWKQAGTLPCRLQSRITRYLFLHAPSLLLPAQSCWLFGKKLLEKVHP